MALDGAGGPRFIPGRAGVTAGYLLPLARELQFNFEEPPSGATAECDRYRGLMLLACWEETLEAEARTAFWQEAKEGEKLERRERAHEKKGAVRGAERL